MQRHKRHLATLAVPGRIWAMVSPLAKRNNLCHIWGTYEGHGHKCIPHGRTLALSPSLFHYRIAADYTCAVIDFPALVSYPIFRSRESRRQGTGPPYGTKRAFVGSVTLCKDTRGTLVRRSPILSLQSRAHTHTYTRTRHLVKEYEARFFYGLRRTNS